MYNLIKLFYKSLKEKKISYSYGGIDNLLNYIFKKKKMDFILTLDVGIQLKTIIHIYYIKEAGTESMLI